MPTRLPYRALRQRALALAAVVFALLGATGAARAADYTDLWWTPSEPGWGVNVVQSDTFMFLTFFIFGQDQKPTWYTGELSVDSSGVFSGGLYLSPRGSYYAVPWNQNDVPAPQRVGSVQFRPSSTNAYQATLTYVVDGVGTVVKPVERQPLTSIRLGGQYVGGQSWRESGCTNPNRNGPYKDVYDLQVDVTTAGVATFTYTFADYTCTQSGPLVIRGTQYTISGARYQCKDANSTFFTTTANMSEIKATAQGIEGRWIANVDAGCREDGQFSAVLR
jgi:hypothetical protein